MYSVGSTGRPKGVAVEHAQASALLGWANQALRRQRIAPAFAGTSVSFDLSVFEIFLPLCFGGTVVLVNDVLDLHDAARERPITLVNTVPSAAAGLLRLGPLPASVRTVNLAGEPLGAGLVDDLYRQPGVKRVFDLYGVSEATTYSTCALRRSGGPVTIGRPIADTEIYMLDRARRSRYRSAFAARICRGRGAAWRAAIWGRPGADGGAVSGGLRSKAPGARLYRTGDLARRRADGAIEFLGRRRWAGQGAGLPDGTGRNRSGIAAVPWRAPSRGDRARAGARRATEVRLIACT